jgi:hypothetical protein
VLAAYDRRRAISNLPDDHLLDAAHTMADALELLGSRSSPTASRSRRSTMPRSTIISWALIPTDECTSPSGCRGFTTDRCSSRF